MAKMFYSLEETAEKLNVSQEQVKEMADAGRLHQFRDGDKLMFKREDVDALSAADGPIEIDEPGMDEDTSEIIPLAIDDDDDAIEVSSGDTDVIELAQPERAGAGVGMPSNDDTAVTEMGLGDLDDGASGPSGLSVFETDSTGTEALAGTPIGGDDDLALDNIGSGSGLLDLTRETDDTSLGAELLNEIYPKGSEGGGPGTESVSSGSGVFDTSAVLDFSSGTGMETLKDTSTPTPSVAQGPSLGSADVYDPVGSGLSGGLLIGAGSVLMVCLIVAIFAMADVPSGLTKTLSQNLPLYDGLFLFACVILGVVGLLIGRAQRS